MATITLARLRLSPRISISASIRRLGDWENNSIGAQVEDSPIDIVLDENNPFSGDWVWGKGSWHMADWAGGILDVEP